MPIEAPIIVTQEPSPTNVTDGSRTVVDDQVISNDERPALDVQTGEKRPSIALRRLQQRMGVSQSQTSLPLRSETPTGDVYENGKKKHRWSSLDVSQLGFSYVPDSSIRAHFDRPRTSIREAFDRSQLHLHHMGEKIEEKLQWNERVRHYTWNFFSMTMATGGIANVLHTVPYRFQGLDVIGTIFFFFNLFLFIMNIILITIRFLKYPETFKASLVHPTESLFVPSAVVSFGTVILNIAQYGLGNTGPWLDDAIFAIFWIYVILAIVASVSVYLIIWSTHTFTLAQMTPIWIFPAYPLLLVGPIAGYIALNVQGSHELFDLLIGGFTCQGVGFLVSLTIYSAFIYRLMTQKLPAEGIRPGMFVSVGPSAFTCDAIIQIAAASARAFPDDFMGDGHMAATFTKLMANFAGLWVWGLAIWFFLACVGAHWSCIGHGHLEFGMTWFSFVFPNTALIAATFAIGEAFDSSAIRWVGCALTLILIPLWFFVFGAMLRAIVQKQVLWPQKQEDRDEGGFKSPPPRHRSFLARTPLLTTDFAKRHFSNPFAKKDTSQV